MTQSLDVTPTQATAYFCPSCGSPSIHSTSSVIEVPRASCRACHWEGPADELLAHEFQPGFISDASMMASLMGDVRKVMQQVFGPLSNVLHKWGFLSEPLKAEELRRYAVAIASAMVRAIFEERDRQERERSRASN